MNRREFITRSLALGSAPWATALLASPARPMPRGKAEHCIFIWLGGGMSQLDTFDPKRRDNPRSAPKVAGSDYASIETAVPGVRFTEHLAKTARLAERLTAIRTINHRIVD